MPGNAADARKNRSKKTPVTRINQIRGGFSAQPGFSWNYSYSFLYKHLRLSPPQKHPNFRHKHAGSPSYMGCALFLSTQTEHRDLSVKTMITTATNNYAVSIAIHSLGLASAARQGAIILNFIMQNKPNFQKAKINVSTYGQMDYIKICLQGPRKNKPNFNPQPAPAPRQSAPS